MGEAKQKSKRLQEFIKLHPFCCFCGGAAPTETIDHVPSRQVFRLKHRPEGLEFPACYKCNELSGPHELVAALMARLLSDNQMNTLEKAELNKLFRSVDKNRHGLLKEMWPTWQQEYDFEMLNHPEKPVDGGVLNAKSPMLNHSIQIFGTKMCLALHYKHRNSILPCTGGVIIRWYSNWDRITNKIPNDLMQLFNFEVTLKQGQWSVADQFGYSYAVPDNLDISAFFCCFRKSFAFVGFVFQDANEIPDVDAVIHNPGNFYD